MQLLRVLLPGAIKPHFEATGKFPWNPPSSPQDTQMRDEFVFRKEKGGDFWTIIYEGKACPPLRDMKGFQYIALLLGHSGEEFSSFQLDIAINQWPCSPPAERRFVDDLIVYLGYKIREGERIRIERKQMSFW